MDNILWILFVYSIFGEHKCRYGKFRKGYGTYS